MNCAQAIDRLLEADLPAITGDGDTEPSDHLSGCEQCRAAAARVLEQQQQLANALSGDRSRVPVERAMAAARVRAARRIPPLRWMAPLAAAAGIAALMLMQSRVNVTPDLAPPVPRGTPVALDLGIAPDRNVAVFESTTQPNIVIVWFY